MRGADGGKPLIDTPKHSDLLIGDKTFSFSSKKDMLFISVLSINIYLLSFGSFHKGHITYVTFWLCDYIYSLNNQI